MRERQWLIFSAMTVQGKKRLMRGMHMRPISGHPDLRMKDRVILRHRRSAMTETSDNDPGFSILAVFVYTPDRCEWSVYGVRV